MKKLRKTTLCLSILVYIFVMQSFISFGLSAGNPTMTVTTTQSLNEEKGVIRLYDPKISSIEITSSVEIILFICQQLTHKLP
ncbi:MAG: hypothetical protein GF364_10465 [Candidatus Lokiarchaeota archaeon]|nr:hypothetical protein [Candidatus Lokiarchaeota archaeon]